MKKLSKLLGLTDEAPKPGHWMESLRSAGTTNLPATTGDVNTSAVERMMNTPMDRRGFMEKTGQAAQAASVAGRMGGALGDLLPQAIESAPASGYTMGGADFLDHLFSDVPDRVWSRFQNTWDEAPLSADDLMRVFPRLQDFRIDEDSEDPARELLDLLRKEVKDDGQLEYFQTLEKQIDEIQGAQGSYKRETGR